MHALVFDKKVIQTEAETFPVHQDLEWIDVGGIDPCPEVGWACNGGIFTAPSAPPPPPTNAEKFEEINRSDRDVILTAIIGAFAELRGETVTQTTVWLKSKL